MSPRFLLHSRRLLLVFAAVPALLLGVACEDDDDDAGTPSATPTTVPKKTATPATAAPTKAPGTTGNARLDGTVDALISGDARKMVAKVEYVSVACVTEVQGAGSPPKCEAGEPAGTKVKAFPASQCEGFYSREANVEQLFKRLLLDSSAKLYGVYKARPDAYGTPESPRGEYGVVMSLAPVGSAPPMAVTAGLDSDGNIVTLYSSCGRTPAEAWDFARPAEEVLRPR